MSTAILVDGGFYRKVAMKKFGLKSPEEAANELIEYCTRHLTEGKDKKIRHNLYRIFYYDCPPINKKVYHPLKGKTVDLSKTAQYKWMIDFISALTKKRKVALRLGSLSEIDTLYSIKNETQKKLISGAIKIEELKEDDFLLTSKQKGVDMKIGIDIASISYKKQVDQIVLIAGDSDFVPAAKLARREGIDFVLDPLGRPVKADLFEHIDGKISRDNRLKQKNN